MEPIYLRLEGLVNHMQLVAAADEDRYAKETTVFLPFGVGIELKISGATRNSWVVRFFGAQLGSAGQPYDDSVADLLSSKGYRPNSVVNSYRKLKQKLLRRTPA